MIPIQFWCVRMLALFLLSSMSLGLLCNRTLAQNRITFHSSFGAQPSRLLIYDKTGLFVLNLNGIYLGPRENSIKGTTYDRLEKYLRQSCNLTLSNKFVSVTKGGKVPELGELNLLLWSDLRSISHAEQSTSIAKRSHLIPISSITEATGWKKDSQGNIQLIDPNITPLTILNNSRSCKTTLKT